MLTLTIVSALAGTLFNLCSALKSTAFDDRLLQAEDLMWDSADPAVRLEGYNEYLTSQGREALRRRLVEVAVKEDDEINWPEELGMDPRKLNRETEEVLKDWYKKEAAMDAEVSEIGRISVKAIARIKTTRDDIEKYVTNLDFNLKGKTQRELAKFFNVFVRAIEDLNKAEYQALRVIQSCIRQTYNTWDLLYQKKDASDDFFGLIAISAQKAFDAFSMQTIDELNELIALIDSSHSGLVSTENSSLQVMRKVKTDFDEHKEQVSQWLNDQKTAREKQMNDLMLAGHITWITGPLVPIILYSVATKYKDPTEAEEQLQKTLVVLDRNTDAIEEDFFELKTLAGELVPAARRLGELTKFVRSDMQHMVKQILAARIATGGGAKALTSGGDPLLLVTIDMWRYAVPNTLCSTLTSMVGRYNTYTKNFPEVAPLDKSWKCEKIGAPPTMQPSEFDFLTECYIGCDEADWSEQVADIRSVKEKRTKLLELMTACSDECDEKHKEPVIAPTFVESPFCKVLASMTETTACIDGEPFIMLSHLEENFSSVHNKVNGNMNSCTPKKQKRSGGSRTDWRGLKVVYVDEETKRVDVDVNNYKMAFTSGGDPVPFGTAGDCYTSAGGCPKGEFSINLEGTGFRLEGYTKWKAVGGKNGVTSADVTISDDGRQASGKCGGGRNGAKCGGCSFDDLPHTRNEGKRIMELTLVESKSLTDLDPKCYEQNVLYDYKVHVDRDTNDAWEYEGVLSKEACEAAAQAVQSGGAQDCHGKCDCPLKIDGVCPIWWTYFADEQTCQLKIQRGTRQAVSADLGISSGATMCGLDHLGDETVEVKCPEHSDETLRALECAERRWVPEADRPQPSRCGGDFMVGMCTSGYSDNCSRDGSNDKFPKVAMCQKRGTGILQRSKNGQLQPARPFGVWENAIAKNFGDKIQCNPNEGYSAVGFCSSKIKKECKCVGNPDNGCEDRTVKHPHYLLCQRGVDYQMPLVKQAFAGKYGEYLACDHGYVLYSMCSSGKTAKCEYNNRVHWQVIECAKVQDPLEDSDSYTIAKITGYYEFVVSGQNPTMSISEESLTRDGRQMENWRQSKFGISASLKVGVEVGATVKAGDGPVSVSSTVKASREVTAGTSAEWTRTMRDITSRVLQQSESEKFSTNCEGSGIEGLKTIWRWVQDTTLVNGQPGPTIKTSSFICTDSQAKPFCHPQDCVDETSCEICLSDLDSEESSEDSFSGMSKKERRKARKNKNGGR